MAWRTTLYAFSLVLIHQVTGDTEGDDVVPFISGSFRAIGELSTEVSSDSNTRALGKFEENYHAISKRASLSIFLEGLETKFVEDLNTGKTYSYTQKTATEPVVCKETTPKDWTDSHIPPDLKVYELTNNQLTFPLRQLLMLDRKFLRNTAPEHSRFRQIPAFYWIYHMNSSNSELEEGSNLYVYSFWINQDWSTASGLKVVPLGFEIVRNSTDPKKRESIQSVNIMHFMEDKPKLDEVQMRSGIVCQGYKGNLEFPNVALYPALSYSMETVLPSGDQMLNSDTWVDTRTRKMRISFDLVSDVGSNRDTYDILVNSMHGSGVVYNRRRRHGSQVSCSVSALDKFDFSDPQILIDVKSQDYSTAHILGSNDAAYTNLGHRLKRDLPAILWQGVRSKWPPGSSGISSLWELDILHVQSLNLPRDQLPLLSAEVTVLQGNPNDKFGQMLSTGTKVIYNFYDVRLRQPGELELTSFDISSCFSADNQKRWEVEAAIPKEVKPEEVRSSVTDLAFLAEWKKALTHGCGLDPLSLRVSQVHGILGAEDRLFIHFTVLGKHPDLPEKLKTEPTLIVANNKLEESVNKGSIKFNAKFGSKTVSVNAKPGSLKEPFTMVKPEPKDDDDNSGMSGGQIAGLVIGLLALVAIIVGVAVFVLKRRGNTPIDKIGLTT